MERLSHSTSFTNLFFFFFFALGRLETKEKKRASERASERVVLLATHPRANLSPLCMRASSRKRDYFQVNGLKKKKVVLTKRERKAKKSSFCC